MKNYVCKVANLEDVMKREQFLIDTHEKNKGNWQQWAKERIQWFKENKIIVYYGFLDGKIICEATANIDKSVDKDSDGLIDENTASVSAFRTNKDYERKGYFSKLYKFMESDLLNRGYKRLTIGVEPTEIRNIEIYKHYGYTKKIKSVTAIYPNGEVIEVDYYEKKLR